MTSPAQRLDGLDLARYIAFVGMVIVNFKIAMGADDSAGFAATISGLFEGRAAATFVVLAGIGLGLAAQRSAYSATLKVTLKRALFLLIIGLLNMTIFEADILHYYAIYFVIAVFDSSRKTQQMIWAIISFNLVFLALVLSSDYSAGWDWTTLTYTDFWTPTGFIRNLFFNGWHPVFPWISFFYFGMILSRQTLSEASTQNRLIGWGALALIGAEIAAYLLMPMASAIDPELSDLLGTSPIPPGPFYIIAGLGAASLVTGLCLRLAAPLKSIGILGLVTPAGRQTLTLYVAHILIGMGTLEALNMLSGQTATSALTAALIFCALVTLYAWVWRKMFKRGPLEALMRAVAG